MLRDDLEAAGAGLEMFSDEVVQMLGELSPRPACRTSAACKSRSLVATCILFLLNRGNEVIELTVANNSS